MPAMLSQPSSADMITPSTSSSSSDTLSADSAGPKEPPRVYDLYSWSAQSPNTRLVYIQNEETANIAVAQLNAKVLGFDLEWRPNFVKGYPENPVALVQLASEDTILLIHVAFMASFPSKLKDLLLDPDVVKAGVGIQKDCKKLYTDHGVDTRNCVDLSLLARTVDNARWKGKYSNPIGLSRLLETYEEFALDKGKTQISNWERALDLRQQNYAANDCHAGLVLYERLAQMAANMARVPQRMWYSFDMISGLLFQPSSGILWHPYNPYYDAGPPPPPRAPKEEGDNSGRAARGGRFRNPRNRTGPQRPLSPTAPSFVPGAKEHSPSPSQSPHPGFAPRPRAPVDDFPRANQVTPIPVPPQPSQVMVGTFVGDMDGFPRLSRSTPRQAWGGGPRTQDPRFAPKGFRGGSPAPGRGQPGRGRGRGRGYAMVVSPTG